MSAKKLYPLLLCAVDEIPSDGAKGFQLNKLNSIFAVRKDDALYLYRNRCPHARLELNWMPDRFLDRNRDYILCAAHGALFEIDSGDCVYGPCPGTRLSPVAHTIIDGQLYLSEDPLDPQE
ncbi:MAG: Rieske (2Fe-2S) protein [Porticoccaceae bacterium]|nr:Rieske (2Fe-2S) protein [Porticoccaceae bacterium]